MAVRARAEVEQGQSLRAASFVAFDTETTGLSPLSARVIEVAGVRFRGDGEQLGCFEALCDPGHPIPGPIQRLTGISQAMVAGKPPPLEVIEQFREFVGPDAIVVAHNASFDLAFIGGVLRDADRPLLLNPVVDSVKLAAMLGIPRGSRSLRRVCEQLGFSSGRYHRAGPDAERVAWLTLRAIEHLLAHPVAGDQPPAEGASDGPPDDPGVAEMLRRVPPLRFADWLVERIALPPGMDELGLALRQGAAVTMDYVRGGGASSQVVRPISLYRQGDRQYLVAWCPPEGVERTYRLERIRSVRVRPETS